MSEYPRAVVGEYGTVETVADIQAEVFAHGPVACHINSNCIEMGMFDAAAPIFSYNCTGHNHAVQLAGWGTDAATGERFWTFDILFIPQQLGDLLRRERLVPRQTRR